MEARVVYGKEALSTTDAAMNQRAQEGLGVQVSGVRNRALTPETRNLGPPGPHAPWLGAGSVGGPTTTVPE